MKKKSAPTGARVHQLTPEALTIQSVAAVLNSWREDQAHAESITLNLSQVQKIDAAGVQLLMAFSHHATQSGKALSLLNPSESVIQSLTLLGLTHLLLSTDGKDETT